MHTTITIRISLLDGSVEQNKEQLRNVCKTITGEVTKVSYEYPTSFAPYDDIEKMADHMAYGAKALIIEYKYMQWTLNDLTRAATHTTGRELKNYY